MKGGKTDLSKFHSFILIDGLIDCIGITNFKSCEKNIAGACTLLDKIEVRKPCT